MKRVMHLLSLRAIVRDMTLIVPTIANMHVLEMITKEIMPAENKDFVWLNVIGTSDVFWLFIA